jgi:two-component system response regulator HydG
VAKSRILIVDDDPAFGLMLGTFFEKNGFETTRVHTGKECLKELKQSDYHLVLTDLRLPDISGIEVLRDIKQNYPQLPVVLMTGYGEIKTAVQAIKLGAYEYVSKPVNPDEILMIVNSVLGPKDKTAIAESAPQADYLTGHSEPSKNLEQHLALVAPTNMSVLIKGESGTGKEYVARKIHQMSDRQKKPFVALDCGALSDELAASELFGHIKGAFTGAAGDKTGQFELADGGTLFLDEIGNLSYQVQIKLLRALQERMIRKVGGKQDIPVDVRIIAASNEDLREAVVDKGFREDLYHRLNEFALEVPALRDRGRDIELFAQYFLDKSNLELGKEVRSFAPEVVALFHRYTWPGNIREMKNIVKRGVLLCHDGEIQLEHLPAELSQTPSKQSTTIAGDLRSQTESQEKEIILATLQKTRFNKSKAADILNIDRKTLYNKLKQYGIDN